MAREDGRNGRIFGFGETVAGYTIPVLNEREIRAAAGLLFVLMFVAIATAALRHNFVLLKYAVTIFLTDILVRILVNPRYAPFLVLGRLIVRNQTPEYVGAAAKKFAWVIGTVLASVMFVLAVVVNTYSPVTGLICLTCLVFLFCETSFDICLGCKVYALIYRQKAQYCPGDVCEVKDRHEIQKTSKAQVAIVLGFVAYVVVVVVALRDVYRVPPHELFGGKGARAAAPDLRVMSFNLRYAEAPDGDNAWDRRRDLLAETIRNFNPDVLGTQECLAGQAAFLQTALPGYAWVGVGRDDGKLAGEMCAVFYRADRFVPAGQGTFWLSETPDVAGSRGWDAALPRIATWVRLRERADSTQAFVFLDTHFDHLGAGARVESGRLLRRRLQDIAGGTPVVVTGDFNAPGDAGLPGPYAALVDTAAAGGFVLRDAYRALHAPAPGEGTFHGFSGGRDGQRIDWILATPAWTPVAADIDRTARDGRLPSDHFPMTAVLRRAGRGSGR